MSPGYILIVDDEPEIRRVVQEILEDEHYRVATAESAEQARALYARERPGLVLLDIWMPDIDGISLLKEWAGGGALEFPVVMMSGHGTVETAVEATRLGAYDFIEKPLSLGKLLVTVERALENEKLKRENRRLRRVIDPEAFFLGRSAAMQRLREQLQQAGATDARVLITGEPGCGKSAAARRLHEGSARRDGPCVEINLTGGGVETVAERLFGAERNGEIVAGAFEQARAGTIVLAQIGELDAGVQAMLLRTLEESAYMRIGGRETLEFDARLIAVHNADLRALAAEGQFREDLFYSLEVVPLTLPPLREHREDVPELASYYLDWLVDNENLHYRKLSTGALNALRNYGWPGNVRELQNVVQRLLILNRGPEIAGGEVEQALGPVQPPRREQYPGAIFERPLRDARDDFERAYLEYHLQKTGGNVAEVARLSEMERTHLYRKLKNLGIHPKVLKD